MMNDTYLANNPLPYNILDKNPISNRQGINPTYQYKKTRVLWLNTAFATSSVSSGTTFFEYSFDIPPFQLYNQTKMRVISFVSNEETAKIVIIKVKNLSIDANSTYNSDKEGTPILFCGHTGVAGMLNNNQFSLSLQPQLITNITLVLSNSLLVRNAGYTINNNKGDFIIGILLEDDDLKLDDVSSIYR